MHTFGRIFNNIDDSWLDHAHDLCAPTLRVHVSRCCVPHSSITQFHIYLSLSRLFAFPPRRSLPRSGRPGRDANAHFFSLPVPSSPELHPAKSFIFSRHPRFLRSLIAVQRIHVLRGPLTVLRVASEPAWHAVPKRI